MNLTSADQVRLVANAMKIQSATRDHVSYTLSQFGRVYLKLDSDTLCPCTSDSENAYAGADINIYYDAIIGEGEVVTAQLEELRWFKENSIAGAVEVDSCWHGCPAAAVMGVVYGGLRHDVRDIGLSSGVHQYGVGNYVARSAQYALGYSAVCESRKYLFHVSALTGWSLATDSRTGVSKRIVRSGYSGCGALYHSSRNLLEQVTNGGGGTAGSLLCLFRPEQTLCRHLIVLRSP